MPKLAGDGLASHENGSGVVQAGTIGPRVYANKRIEWTPTITGSDNGEVPPVQDVKLQGPN